MVALVTFIVPSVGRGSILRTVKSLLAMNNSNWVALIGFDHVKESVRKALKLPIDERVQYIDLPKKQGGGNNFGGGVRNFLIEKAITPWVAFVDDDDSLRPEYVDMLISESEAYPTAKCIMFRMSYGQRDNTVLPPLTLKFPKVRCVGISFAVQKQFLDEHNIQFQNGREEDFKLLQKIHAVVPIVFSTYIGYNIRF